MGVFNVFLFYRQLKQPLGLLIPLLLGLSWDLPSLGNFHLKNNLNLVVNLGLFSNNSYYNFFDLCFQYLGAFQTPLILVTKPNPPLTTYNVLDQTQLLAQEVGLVYVHSFMVLLLPLVFLFPKVSAKHLNKVCLGFILTLLLGALWASGDSTWGLLWTHDIIEYILLIYIIFSLTPFHDRSLLVTQPQALYFLWLFRTNHFSSRHHLMTSVEAVKGFETFQLLSLANPLTGLILPILFICCTRGSSPVCVKNPPHLLPLLAVVPLLPLTVPTPLTITFLKQATHLILLSFIFIFSTQPNLTPLPTTFFRFLYKHNNTHSFAAATLVFFVLYTENSVTQGLAISVLSRPNILPLVFFFLLTREIRTRFGFSWSFP